MKKTILLQKHSIKNTPLYALNLSKEMLLFTRTVGSAFVLTSNITALLFGQPKQRNEHPLSLTSQEIKLRYY